MCVRARARVCVYACVFGSRIQSSRTRSSPPTRLWRSNPLSPPGFTASAAAAMGKMRAQWRRLARPQAEAALSVFDISYLPQGHHGGWVPVVAAATPPPVVVRQPARMRGHSACVATAHLLDPGHVLWVCLGGMAACQDTDSKHSLSYSRTLGAGAEPGPRPISPQI